MDKQHYDIKYNCFLVMGNISVDKREAKSFTFTYKIYLFEWKHLAIHCFFQSPASFARELNADDSSSISPFGFPISLSAPSSRTAI
jgi:hypothetical protein